MLKYYIRKKRGFNSNEKILLTEFNETYPNIKLNTIEIYNFYELINFDDQMVKSTIDNIICDKVVDDLFQNINSKYSYLVEPLPSQFDQRRSSAIDSMKLLCPLAKDYDIKTAVLYVLKGISEEDFNYVYPFFVNPIESRLKKYDDIKFIKSEEQYINDKSKYCFDNLNLSMDYDDYLFLLDTFETENRVAKLGEIKIIDTYWSDHCRHTTFNTILDDVLIDDEEINRVFLEFGSTTTLMTIASKYAKDCIKDETFNKKEDTTEDNAISIVINEDGKDYLLQFKNETHNHPTEIEPFGGAATCIGGAIRDPLSGRAYVYQGMRIAGVGDILQDSKDTLDNKLYQSVISKKSALGFSSYGNQIGVPTMFNKEIFDKSYVAKHLELGCVVGICPKDNVTRKDPVCGDLIVMLGGKTGRDGIGGATGSSKVQALDVSQMGSEVQKGNACEQRNLLRLFTNSEFSKVIKKSNDFGAGGVSVCALELADGVDIYLDKIVLKDQNMDIIDIALSESQERMAIIIDKNDLELVVRLSIENNVLYSVIGKVTSNNNVNMLYNNKIVYQFSRNLLDSGGVKKYQKVVVSKQKDVNYNLYKNCNEMFNDRNLINNSIQDEYFDSTVLSNTVLLPYGGVNQDIKSQVSIAMIMGLKKLKSVVAYGFNPKIMKQNPFVGAQIAVVDSVVKQIANGVLIQDIILSFQEYFARMDSDEVRFSRPLMALLGGYKAQKEFGIVALGGKDSMSGTYKNIEVVDTFVSFSLGVKKDDNVVLNYFNSKDEYIYIIDVDPLDYNIHIYNKFLQIFDKITSSFVLGDDPLISCLIKMSKNNIGFNVKTGIDYLKLKYGCIVFTSKSILDFQKLGVTCDGMIFNGKFINDMFNYKIFNRVYPFYNDEIFKQKENNIVKYDLHPKKVDTVKVLILVFEGSNSYIELKDRFKEVGCDVTTYIFNDKYDIDKSIDKFVSLLSGSNVFCIPGGFSKADEPDGSGKYIVNFLRNTKVYNAVNNHLEQDKLIFGICNGFQALLKSGILTDEPATLFYNANHQHISKVVDIKYCKSYSPFFINVEPGVYKGVISHGEGRFCINSLGYKNLINRGQIVSTYCYSNPNQSDYNVEGIISNCGRIYGKMAHIERYKDGLYQNIEGNFDVQVFSSIRDYFKGE